MRVVGAVELTAIIVFAYIVAIASCAVAWYAFLGFAWVLRLVLA